MQVAVFKEEPDRETDTQPWETTTKPTDIEEEHNPHKGTWNETTL